MPSIFIRGSGWTPVLLQGALVLVYFAMSLCFGGAVRFVAATPASIWGRMIALYLLIGNPVGFGFVPVSVPPYLNTAGSGVGHALGMVALFSVVLCFYAARVQALD